MTSESERPHRLWNEALKAAAVGAGVFYLGFEVAVWTTPDLHGFMALLDNLAGGVAVGLVVFWYERARHRNVEQLRKSQRELMMAQAQAHLGSWIETLADGEITWSDELYRLWGLEPRSVPASPDLFNRGLHPDDKARVEELVRRSQELREPFDCVHRILTPDGGVRVVHARGEWIVNSLGQHVQFAGTVLDITERKQQEQAIQELSGRLIGAQEQERARIARELHDNISQQIAIVCIELQQLKDSLPGSLHEERERAQALWHKAAAISTELQQLSHQLHSTKLKHLGVTAAVRGLCREFLEQQGIEADFQSQNVPRDLDTDIALALFRVAQESLHNVAKHSGAKQVRLELVATAAEIVLRVSDDGSGFDTGAAAHRNGLGMVSMSERLRLLGGTLSVTSRPLKGTRIEAAVPLSRKDDA